MKFWEAMKCLEEGKKVRKCEWRKDEYIYIDENVILTQGKLKYNFYNPTNSEWEIYDDRKEADDITKELYKVTMKACRCATSYFYFINNTENSNYILKLCDQLEEMNKYYKLDK